MADETDADDEPEQPVGNERRSTAPQSAYTDTQVVVGAVVAVIGIAVTFGVPLAVTL